MPATIDSKYLSLPRKWPGYNMDFDPILALISIIFGILVIAFPNLLGYIVGIFFILLGIWLLIDYMNKGEKKGASAKSSQQPPAEKK